MKFCVTCNGPVYDDQEECTACLKSKFVVEATPEPEKPVEVKRSHKKK